MKRVLSGMGRPQWVVCAVVFLLVTAGYAAVAGRPTARLVGVPIEQPLALAPGMEVAAPVDCARLNCLALSFDDGPSSRLTPQILDILDRHNAPATFFVLGSHVAGREALLRRMHTSGHEIGNHSWSHPYFTRIAVEQVESEISRTQEAILRAGVPAPHLFRPPYGDINPSVLAHIPLSVVRWNIDPEDWRPSRQPRISEHLAQYAKRGGVVVLHDTEATTAAILDQLITELRARDFTLVTVSELLGLAPGQPGVFFGRN